MVVRLECIGIHVVKYTIGGAVSHEFYNEVVKDIIIKNTHATNSRKTLLDGCRYLEVSKL